MPYTDFTDVIQDDADAIRYITGSTSSIAFVDMPNAILSINGLRFSFSTPYYDYSWQGEFLPYITGSEFITDMSYMFYQASLGDYPDFSNFRTSRATDMSHMFCAVYTDSNYSSLDLSTFDTSNVTNMSGMFRACYYDSIDVSNFDTSKVTDMSEMFDFLNNNAYSTLDVSNFDTSQVTNMREMFSASGTFNATPIHFDLSNWDTSKVTNMYRMFNGLKGTIDLSNWDTSNVTTMEYMFNGVVGTMWIPSTFVATAVISDENKPFYYYLPSGSAEIYTDATDAQTQGWGTINPKFTIHYNSTHQDFLNAISQ